jgi:hypothetical protein
MAAIAARLDAMESRPAPTPAAPIDASEGGSALPATWSGAARATAMLATTLLGVSGPAGWGIIAASTVGGWLMGRRLKRRKSRAVSRELREEELTSQSTESSSSQLPTHGSQPNSSAEATAAAEGAFPAADCSGDDELSVAIDQQAPIERDDREARELLRLSQLEGRDPLQDAVAGRLALDRLDALAESDGDPNHIAWADELRRELRERFNEIAPTKFKFGNDECSNDE